MVTYPWGYFSHNGGREYAWNRREGVGYAEEHAGETGRQVPMVDHVGTEAEPREAASEAQS